jgi:hypothetical protein
VPVFIIRLLFVLAFGLLSVCAEADETSLLRVFLRDGTTLTSYGEYARVGNRIVFSMPLGTQPDGRARLQLVSLPEAGVDWARTDGYRDAARASRYAATQGESDFAVMTGEVAQVLNEIAFTNEPGRKLRLAEEARAKLSAWPAQHFGYRAREVREIAALIDETIADLKASAGGHEVDLSLVANIEPAPHEPLLAPPTSAEIVAQALSVADMADTSADRIATLRSTIAFIDGMPESGSDVGLRRARTFAQEQLTRELDTDRRYAGMTRRLIAEASSYAAQADVKGIERVIARVDRLDGQLGRRRPDDVRTLLTALHTKLDSARRLRLAWDRWRLRSAAYQSYSRLVKAPLAELELMGPGLADIKTLAGPDAATLRRLADHAATASRSLHLVVPPPDIASIHSLLVSACQMAGAAVDTRLRAITSGDMTVAWNASAAAAGSMLLLARAHDELAKYLAPPRQP